MIRYCWAVVCIACFGGLSSLGYLGGLAASFFFFFWYVVWFLVTTFWCGNMVTSAAVSVCVVHAGGPFVSGHLLFAFVLYIHLNILS